MSSYYFSDIPNFHIEKLRAVRDSYDNLLNILQVAEIVNCCAHCRSDEIRGVDFAIFTGDFARILVKKENGFFTMTLPFQIIDHGYNIFFNYDNYNIPVHAEFISIMRNSIEACRDYGYSHEDIISSLCENFNLDIRDAVNYCDVFTSLLTEDHGYFRFDDDLIGERGRIHPRYHFDFFYKNSTSVKIGINECIDASYFLGFFDRDLEKPYLR
ncbi:hypothetical protein Pcaca04_30810 [Pectobacterium carotovorum subsp. carotovorum]|nr:hypothetical protein Pcaca04_30810 [Pectobacterium carotovorum subsp. carotovorum]